MKVKVTCNGCGADLVIVKSGNPWPDVEEVIIDQCRDCLKKAKDDAYHLGFQNGMSEENDGQGY